MAAKRTSTKSKAAAKAGQGSPAASRQRTARKPSSRAMVPAGPLAAPRTDPPAEPEAPQPRRRIRVVFPGSEPTPIPQTAMGRAIRPFAKPAQSGTYSPWAITQARRGR